jgi:Cys-tRNA(Pro)/Cys-tRNA(Cys) deacylase
LIVTTAKTNAVRLLERMRVPFELRAYEVDPEDLSAETVARKIGMPPKQVFKTLVARGDKHGVCLAVVPGNCELDLKTLARATGDKKIDTAYACMKPYPVCLVEMAQLFDRMRLVKQMKKAGQ